MDIVDHLRRCVAGLELPVPLDLAADAADEIERLRRLIEILRAALDRADVPRP